MLCGERTRNQGEPAPGPQLAKEHLRCHIWISLSHGLATEGGRTAASGAIDDFSEIRTNSRLILEICLRGISVAGSRHGFL
jgi:hypothetical protein